MARIRSMRGASGAAIGMAPGNGIRRRRYCLPNSSTRRMMVIFAQIGAGLHLDHLEENLAGVGESMNFTLRNIDAFVFAQGRNLIADRHFGVPLTQIQCSARW